MRTTIDIPEEQYLALRSLATRRRLRGFSPLIAEAIDLLLAEEAHNRVDDALALGGVLDDAEAETLVDHVRELRGRPGRVVDDGPDPEVA